MDFYGDTIYISALKGHLAESVTRNQMPSQNITYRPFGNGCEKPL